MIPGYLDKMIFWFANLMDLTAIGSSAIKNPRPK